MTPSCITTLSGIDWKKAKDIVSLFVGYRVPWLWHTYRWLPTQINQNQWISTNKADWYV